MAKVTLQTGQVTMNSKIRLCVVAAIAFSMLPTSPAIAVSGLTTQKDLEHGDNLKSKSFLSAYGVPEETQEHLIGMAAKGHLPMSDTPGTIPISTEFFEREDVFLELKRYADGSVSAVELDKGNNLQEGSVAPKAITGCAQTIGSGYTNYTNCRIHYRSLVFSYGFYGSFTIVPGDNNDMITGVGSPFLEYALGHKEVSRKLNISQERETVSSDATATLTITFEVLKGVAGSVTRGVRLLVGGNSFRQGDS